LVHHDHSIWLGTTMATVSVIIPTLNEESYIGLLLADLYRQKQQLSQVLVVDGHSTDQTEKVVSSWTKKWHAVQFVRSPHKGVGFQRDWGGRHACKHKKVAGSSQPHYLYFLDADTRISETFILTTVSLMKRNKLDAACPQYVPVTSSWAIKLIFGALNELFRFGQKHFPAGAGPCMLVTAELFKKIDGFNKKLLIDDLDFVHRAGQLGNFKILSVPVFVSTRRFEKYGILITALQYVKISWYFVRKNTARTNELSYEFGKFNKN
jgi:glycosyltransferase involved in cell wall biosynthesis